jgi:undecaprenyl-diphosphatase
MFEAVILGIIQGLTEFLPVSSSAHLILMPWFFKWSGAVDTLSFDIALHFGTLLALLVYFRNDWISIIRTSLSKDAMLWKLIVGTIPAGLAGILIHDWLEEHRLPVAIAFTLSAVSVLMLVSESRYGDKNRRDLESIGFSDALFIGIAQAIALIPGVSRSGITIIAGMAKKLSRETAARFSFLLGTPAIAGATLLEARKVVSSGDIDLTIFGTGIIVSTIVGYLAIKYLIIFLRTFSLRPFAYYRFLIAFVIILAVLNRG